MLKAPRKKRTMTASHGGGSSIAALTQSSTQPVTKSDPGILHKLLNHMVTKAPRNQLRNTLNGEYLAKIGKNLPNHLLRRGDEHLAKIGKKLPTSQRPIPYMRERRTNFRKPLPRNWLPGSATNFADPRNRMTGIPHRIARPTGPVLIGVE